MTRKLILIKHSMPEFEKGKLWYEWPLSEDGRRRCIPLAEQVASYQPTAIAASPERKAVETAGIIGSHIEIPVQITEGLQENDRTGFRFAQDEYEQQFQEFFRKPNELIIGQETATQALKRFTLALEGFVCDHPAGNLVVVAHGTVITLFTAAHNDIEPFQFWLELGIPSFVVLSLPDYRLIETLPEA